LKAERTTVLHQSARRLPSFFTRRGVADALDIMAELSTGNIPYTYVASVASPPSHAVETGERRWEGKWVERYAKPDSGELISCSIGVPVTQSALRASRLRHSDGQRGPTLTLRLSLGPRSAVDRAEGCTGRPAVRVLPCRNRRLSADPLFSICSTAPLNVWLAHDPGSSLGVKFEDLPSAINALEASKQYEASAAEAAEAGEGAVPEGDEEAMVSYHTLNPSPLRPQCLPCPGGAHPLLSVACWSTGIRDIQWVGANSRCCCALLRLADSLPSLMDLQRLSRRAQVKHLNLSCSDIDSDGLAQLTTVRIFAPHESCSRFRVRIPSPRRC